MTRKTALTADIRLIVGLGNPGADYVETRHNAGFWMVDLIADEHAASFRFEKRFNGDLCKFSNAGRDCYLLKPQTFMNHSGRAVSALARYYKIKAEQILVLHDELDLPPGTSRLKQGGGHGGHNGLRDCIAHLGSNDFFRVRIGIGHPGNAKQVIDYVLKRPSISDRKAIDNAIQDALAVMSLVLGGNVEKAMHALHTE